MPDIFRSLIVFMGLPSSGKSTLAKLLADAIFKETGIPVTIIGTDEIRTQLSQNSDLFDPTLEPVIKQQTLQRIQSALKTDVIVINDDMNYYKSMRHELKQIATETAAHFILIYIQIPLERALEWNHNRGLPIPQEVIKKVYERFDPPSNYKWDTPLVTLRTDQESPKEAVQLILPRLFPIISHPFLPHRKPPISTPTSQKFNRIDKLTREVITEFAKLYKDPVLLKKLSSYRKSYLKTVDKTKSLEEVKIDFKNQLQAFISQIKQAT
ncbi:MAG: AAA family ATPase [Candidatus Helarchaeota archaeon]